MARVAPTILRAGFTWTAVRRTRSSTPSQKFLSPIASFFREAVERFWPADECMASTHQSRSRQLAVRLACFICELDGGATVRQPNRGQVRVDERYGLIRTT